MSLVTNAVATKTNHWLYLPLLEVRDGLWCVRLELITEQQQTLEVQTLLQLLSGQRDCLLQGHSLQLPVMQ